MKKLRLRYVGTADFRKSEATMLAELLEEKVNLRLTENDVVMFRSGTGKQVLFVQRVEKFDHNGRENGIVASRRLRISWGQWSELMIADYARMVDIKLENLPTLEEFFKRIRREHKAAVEERRASVH